MSRNPFNPNNIVPTAPTLDSSNRAASTEFVHNVHGGGGSVLQVGATAITGGTPTSLLYDNSGVLGELPASGGGTTNFLRADGTWAAAGGTPAGLDTELQYNNGGAFGGIADIVYNATNDRIEFNNTSGLYMSVVGPIASTAAGDNFGAAFNVISTGLLTTPGHFSGENAVEITQASTYGQNVYGSGTNAKKTFIALNMASEHYGAGQHFGYAVQNIVYSQSDAFIAHETLTFCGGPIQGDEGVGFRSQSACTQIGNLTLSTITAVTRSAAVDTTTTADLTADITPQSVPVVSTAGMLAGDWLIIERQLPSSGPNYEDVQVISVDDATHFTCVVRNNHGSGVTVTPALVLDLATAYQMGQGRVLINLSGASYSTGTIASIDSSITPFTIKGSGTTWAVDMVGGDANNIGAISFDSDTYTGDPFSGTPGTSAGPLREWYQIKDFSSATAMGAHSHQIGGNEYYLGIATGGTYMIRPAATIMRNVNDRLICDTSLHTWTVGDTVEACITPFPNVSGFPLVFYNWTHGGKYNSMMSLSNEGARAFNYGLVVGANVRPSGGQNDASAMDVGVLVDQADVGVKVTNAITAALQLGTYGDASDDGSRIAWVKNGVSLGPNLANLGFDLTPTATRGSVFQFYDKTKVPGAGGLGSADFATWPGMFRLAATTFANLPAANASLKGTAVTVSDSTTATLGATITGGGGNLVEAWCNGTNWIVGGNGATAAGGTPGGDLLTLQYNNAGAFDGMSGTSWDDANRALTMTGATVTADHPIFDATQTWDAAAIQFTGTRINVTDSASTATSLLADWQVGGVSKHAITKDGSIARSFTAQTTTATVTISITSPAVITWAAHGFVPGQVVRFSTTGALPTGITAGTDYYMIATGETANSFQISATPGGAAINTSGTQSGVHTGTGQATPVVPQPLISIGQSGLVGSETGPALLVAPFWNTSGAAVGLDVRLTNGRAGSAASRIFRVWNGTNTFLAVDGNGNPFATKLDLIDASSNYVVRIDSGFGGGQAGVLISSNVGTGGRIRFGTGNAWGLTASTDIVSEAAGIMSFRTLAVAQGLRVYKTTDAGLANYERAAFDWTATADILRIGTEKLGTGSARSIQFIVGGAVTDNLGVSPATKTGDYAVVDTDKYLIFNGGASITVTLPAAATYPSRELVMKNIATQTVVSASSNVVPAGSATPGTAILAATAGKFVTLVSDGANWVVMESN